jgi:hypothetical protein
MLSKRKFETRALSEFERTPDDLALRHLECNWAFVFKTIAFQMVHHPIRVVSINSDPSPPGVEDNAVASSNASFTPPLIQTIIAFHLIETFCLTRSICTWFDILAHRIEFMFGTILKFLVSFVFMVILLN